MRPGLLRRSIEALECGEKWQGELTSDCVTVIRACDGEIHAWAEVNPQPAISRGSLEGIPFGVKDIFETKGLRTEYGSPLFAGRQGDVEASLVTLLRQRGAVLLGKTHTTAFAYYDAGPTRNPLNLAHTPGGSSSGSAAAVAADMVPFALGSQTQGSILRPASYCGICGFKPTYGLLPTDGILPFAPSLDTAGFFTQTADDMYLLWERMGYPFYPVVRRRLGSLLRPSPQIPGWVLDEIELPFDLDEVLKAVQLINAYEGARTHRDRWLEYGARLGPKLSQLVSEGLKISETAYQAALEVLVWARRKVSGLYMEYPVLISAAATGTAPRGLASTGDPRMNAPWTGLHGPAIAIPGPGTGLRVGLQLTADIGNDDLLLETARLLEASVQG